MTKKNIKATEGEEIAKEMEQNNEIEDSSIETNENQTTEDTTDETQLEADAIEDSVNQEAYKIEELEKQVAEMQDKHIRLIAEYDNYRRRSLKEKMELTKMAGEKVFVNILPVLDDFERALKHLSSASDIDSVKEGIDLIYSKFKGFLTQNGLKEIETTNSEFNADIHEAITKVPAPSPELKGKIVDCVERGYMLDEKVIRYPKVVVGE